MPGVGALLEEIFIAALMSVQLAPPRSQGFAWALRGLMALLVSVGTVLLAYGVYEFLIKQYPADVAALLTAAGAFAMALLVFLGLHFNRGRNTGSPASVTDIAGSYLRSIVGDLCSELEAPIRENPKTAVLLAALAGFMATSDRR